MSQANRNGSNGRARGQGYGQYLLIPLALVGLGLFVLPIFGLIGRAPIHTLGELLGNPAVGPARGKSSAV
ncbi:MAG TPA: hypothetical protein VM869_27120 [Enhygromyxa sp.]|nr:hypothetical protein [Enhygromyxa sp.]